MIFGVIVVNGVVLVLQSNNFDYWLIIISLLKPKWIVLYYQEVFGLQFGFISSRILIQGPAIY
jgi:hypothetical protein